MGGNDYENVNNWRPILIDNVRDPWKSWWEHRQRGSKGGVDCVANVGTPIYAPADCYTRNTDVEAGGSGGRTVTAIYNTGFGTSYWKDQFMHLETLVPEGSKPKGAIIGYTGMSVASGYPRVAQHLHWHRIDPRGSYIDPYGSTDRRNPWDYFTGSGTAGGGTTPIEEIDMTQAKFYRNTANGDLRIMNPETGLEYGVPSWANMDLIVGWGIFEGVKTKTPIELPDNVFRFIQALCAAVREGRPA